MRSRRCIAATVALSAAILVAGCGTPREKSAPCKRPANLSSYASMESECGPMRPLNPDRAAALTAIQNLASGREE